MEISNDFTFRRISAERNIVPEAEDISLSLDIHGNGASNLIRTFLNYDDHSEEIIEQDLLAALNEIMYPDSVFISIRIQQVKAVNKSKNSSLGHDDTFLWEVFLQEQGCDRFALSQSGSGLKTIILLLLNLLIIPKTDEYKDKKIVYGFEELENNLHPYLQRKIFDYIYDFALKEDTYVFLTTHSHVAINAFFDKTEAALYHVTKKKNVSQVKKIESFLDKIEILDDLDVKASDLFQSNGIIWVEGPSDKIYIKRWLDVFCDCDKDYQDGTHYQFLYYGGRVLSHYSSDEKDYFINILTTNHNAAIVMDSDKRNAQTPIGETKKRIIAEFDKYKMFSWITKGKEVENYISVDAINKAFNCKIPDQCRIYENFPEYINAVRKNFSSQKVKFAHDVKDCITAEISQSILDLKQQIRQLYSQIQAWNK